MKRLMRKSLFNHQNCINKIAKSFANWQGGMPLILATLKVESPVKFVIIQIGNIINDKIMDDIDYFGE